MGTIAQTAVQTLRNMLAGENGIVLTPDVPGYTRGPVAVPVQAGNIPADLAERSPVSYPALLVYCDKLSNSQREKFRTFSGKAQLAIEIRASADQTAATEGMLQTYTDSVLRVLHASRGDWGGGQFYGGGYEVSFGPMKRGGLNYLQISRVSISLDITLD